MAMVLNLPGERDGEGHDDDDRIVRIVLQRGYERNEGTYIMTVVGNLYRKRVATYQPDTKYTQKLLQYCMSLQRTRSNVSQN